MAGKTGSSLCKRAYRKGNAALGDGNIRICVPLMGANEDILQSEAKRALTSGCDMVEWRVDYLKRYRDFGVVSTALSILHRELKGMPLIFTFRTRAEGGEGDLEPEEYVSLYKYIMGTGNADFFDVEYNLGAEVSKELISRAEKEETAVILSCHDFNKTPAGREMYDRLLDMEARNPIAVKLAVMPKNSGDVLELMTASRDYSCREEALPLISMSMGALGSITRVAGHITGSCMTFAAMENTSAPGQLSMEEAVRTMCTLGARSTADNIILIGFMGVGKSSVSRYLKKRYAMETLEMDALIAEREGKSIPEIFEEHGEEYFRGLETALLRELAGYKNTVISTGGGAPMREENVSLMKKAGRVFLLRAAPETILERVKHNHNRPLLENNKNVDFIKNLMEQRREKYESAAHHIIDTDGKPLYKICQEIMESMGK